MQPGSRNQRPNLLTSLMNVSLVQRLPREMHLCRSSTNLPNLPSFLEILQNPHVLLTFGEVQNPVPLAPATQNHIWTFKSGPSMCFFKCVFTHFDFEVCFAPQRRALFRHLNFGPSMVCFAHFDLEMCFAPQLHALFRHLNFQKWSGPGVLCTFWLQNVLRVTTACTFSTSQLPKVVRAWCALHILTWKCASHHNCMHFFDIATSKSAPNLVWFAHFAHFDLEMCFASQRLASGLHFFDISTSKSGPNMACFVHFDLEMCLTPQQRALFRHLNFQKWSEHGVFCTFWLGNVLRATTTCNFSFVMWPHGSAPAALAILLFDPPEPQIIGETQCFATFLPFRAPTFSRAWIFFLLTLSLLWSSLFFSSLLWLFPPLLFHLSILSEVWLLNFFRIYSTSKLLWVSFA